MAVNWNKVLHEAKTWALPVGIVVLLILSVKQCSDGNKSRETNETVKKIAENVDTIKQERRLDADTIKAVTKSTNKIVRRTEKKVDEIRAVEDAILAKIDSCCDCGKKQEVKPVKKQDENSVKPQPKPQSKPTPKQNSQPQPTADTAIVWKVVQTKAVINRDPCH